MVPADEYTGGVLSQEIDGGRASAVLSFSPRSLLAVTPEGQFFRLDFEEIELEVGGASGLMWFCRNRSRGLTLFSEADGFVEALERAAQAELGPALARLRAERGASARRTLWGWCAVLAVLAVLGLVAYLAMGQLGRAGIKLLPRSVDRQLGELAIENMELGGPVTTDPVLASAIDEMVGRLAKAGGEGFKFQVRIVDAPVVNAFALPGGKVVVYTGLLRVVKTPEQVAGVLAHEIAHVTRRHGLERIAQSLGIVALIQLLFGDATGAAAVAVEVLQQSAVQSYGRDQERQADSTGVETLARSAIDPRALAEVFAVLREHEKGKLSLPAFLASHPDLESRIREVRSAAKTSGFRAAKPFAFRWEEVQAHVGRAP